MPFIYKLVGFVFPDPSSFPIKEISLAATLIRLSPFGKSDSSPILISSAPIVMDLLDPLIFIPSSGFSVLFPGVPTPKNAVVSPAEGL